MTLCLVRCSVPSQISLGRTPHVLDTAGREVNLKEAPEGLCSCERAPHWELALQLMHADVPSKGTAKLAIARCPDIGEKNVGLVLGTVRSSQTFFSSFVAAFRKISPLALEAELSKYVSKGSID